MQELTLIYGDRGGGKTTLMVSYIYQLAKEYQTLAGTSFEDACKSVPILHNIAGLKIGMTFDEFITKHNYLGFRNIRSFFQPIYEDKNSVYNILLGYTFFVDEATHLYINQRDLDADTKKYLDRMRHYGHTAYFASVTLDYPKGFCEACQNYVQAVTDAHNPFPFCHMYIRRTGATVRHRDSYAGFFLRRKNKKIWNLFESAVCKPTFKQAAYRPAMYLSVFATLVIGYFFYHLAVFFNTQVFSKPDNVAGVTSVPKPKGASLASQPPSSAPTEPPPDPELVPCLPGYPMSRFQRDKGTVPLHVSSYMLNGTIYIYHEERWQALKRVVASYVMTRDGIFLMLPPTEYCFAVAKK